MHRPPQRRDSLRQRVSEGRVRREARERRVYATLRVTRRTIAVVAGLAMLGGVATVTQVASASNDPAAQFIGTGNECAVETSALEAHVEEEADGFRHVHYRGKFKGKHKKHGNHGGGDAAPDDDAAADPVDCVDEGPDGTTGGNVPGGDSPDGGNSPDGENPDGGDSPDGETPDGGDSPDGENPDGEAPDGGDSPDGDDPDGDNPGNEVPEDPDDPIASQVLGTDCSQSNLETHTGLQDGPRCVEIAMGEVGAASQNPTLLITNAPSEVSAGEAFTIQVSTRNLIRDRFLPAGQAGYYRESSFLTPEGLTRGHFHTGCRLLPDPNVAEQPDADPAFFVAIEDSQGGADADFVNVEIPGLDEPGLYRCMAWAGDPTHRVPMMQFARHFVAVDVVRILVT